MVAMMKMVALVEIVKTVEIGGGGDGGWCFCTIFKKN
jgi:hypothetical protein